MFEFPYQVYFRWNSVEGTGIPTNRRRPKTIAAKSRRKRRRRALTNANDYRRQRNTMPLITDETRWRRKNKSRSGNGLCGAKERRRVQDRSRARNVNDLKRLPSYGEEERAAGGKATQNERVGDPTFTGGRRQTPSSRRGSRRSCRCVNLFLT